MKFFESQTYRNSSRVKGHKLDYLMYFNEDYYPLYFLSENVLKQDLIHLLDGGFVAENHIPTKGVTEIKSVLGKYADFLEKFKYYDALSKYYYKIKGVEHSVLFRKGEIYSSKGEILLCTMTNSHDIFIKPRVLNPKFLKVYISVEFQTNPIYKTFYDKLKKDFIDLLMISEVDIVIAKSEKIFNELFRRSFKLDFENITGLSAMFDKDVEIFYNTFDPVTYEQEILQQNPHVEVRVLEVPPKIKEEQPRAVTIDGYEHHSYGISNMQSPVASTTNTIYSGGTITSASANTATITMQDGSRRAITMDSALLDVSSEINTFDSPSQVNIFEERDLPF